MPLGLSPSQQARRQAGVPLYENGDGYYVQQPQVRAYYAQPQANGYYAQPQANAYYSQPQARAYYTQQQQARGYYAQPQARGYYAQPAAAGRAVAAPYYAAPQGYYVVPYAPQ